LVSEAAKRQPTLPVQATRPARIELALVEGHARDEEILPDGKTDVAVAEAACNAGEPAHLLCGEPTDRQHDADPVEPLLRLRVHADMG
jgi:hypothetical protein